MTEEGRSMIKVTDEYTTGKLSYREGMSRLGWGCIIGIVLLFSVTVLFTFLIDPLLKQNTVATQHVDGQSPFTNTHAKPHENIYYLDDVLSRLPDELFDQIAQEMAVKDFVEGHPYHLVFGLYSDADKHLSSYEKKHGLQPFPIAGCLVTDRIMRFAQVYNQTMYEIVSESNSAKINAVIRD